MRLRTILLLAAAVISPAGAQAPSDSAIRAIIRERVDAGLFAGIAVGIVTRDASGAPRVVAYGPAAGVAPFDGNTVFEIGSITKTFTTGILADMVARGEVALDDPVAKHLPPGTVIPAQGARQIMLLDLATQSSALPRQPLNLVPKDLENPYADYTPAQMFAFLAALTPPRPIGATYEYSNLGMALLGLALQHRAGQDYETLVAERILRPLGMTDTRIALNPSMQSRLAPGHAEVGKRTKNWDLPSFAAAGALRSTVNDMLRYVRANLDTTSRPLGATFATTHGERHAGPAPHITIGLGWTRLRTPAGRTLVFHDGATGGYHSFAGFDPLSGVGVVVLTNTAQGVNEIGFHLLDSSVPLPKVRKAITLTPSQLDTYLGIFELAPGFTLNITRAGEQLFARATGQPAFPLFAESDGAFFLRAIDAQVVFTKDAAGVVTGLVLHQGGAQRPAAKK